MSGWAGFSEAEVRKMQQKDEAAAASLSRGRRPAAPSSNHRSRQQLQRERALHLNTQAAANASLLPPEQQLTKPKPQEQQQNKPPPPTPAQRVMQREESKAPSPAEKAPEVRGSTEHVKPSEVKPSAGTEEPEDAPLPKELETQEVAIREKSRLEQLQTDQKTIEEGNKRKKALLTKTIAEKSKQTAAEAVKLKRIQKELQALDDMVSNDIGILRGRIETASWEFSTARKRYEKAEAEYVTAKLDLHKKTELKEQLTEHLCAIIQQNELRKASKLTELMLQLQLGAIANEEAAVECLEGSHGNNGTAVVEKTNGRSCEDGNDGNGSAVEINKEVNQVQATNQIVDQVQATNQIVEEERDESEPKQTEQKSEESVENCVTVETEAS